MGDNVKRKIISGIKIYAVCIFYILLISFIYSFYLIKSNNDSNNIFLLILGITTFILLGLLYGNMIHKKGLIVGILVGLSHILLINLIFFLATQEFNISFILIMIYTISSALGSVLGMTFKKII
ncbi:MAG: TIGR04086 family membrane protein [Erysipelotrichaceae bacterium]|nr:TIGR04086 family membrane protein [Erysipelotrichaceae bacterium]